jgi:ABC-type nitrate/sulfonate/bicarbonate transport system permease component
MKWLLPLLPIAAFLLVWQILAKAEVINPSLFPAPTDILGELAGLHSRELPARSLMFSHIGATLKRLAFASLIGIVAGVMIGVLMGVSRPLHRFLDPLISVAMPIPGIAMVPLFIVWMGFGDRTIISLGAIAAFFPITYNTVAGVRSLDVQLVRAARIMGASRMTILFGVYLPWAAGHVLMGLKLGLARCWRTVIAVEFIAAANWGLGYMIWDAAEYLRAGIVYGGIFLLVLLYFLMEKGLVSTIERNTLVKWGVVQK